MHHGDDVEVHAADEVAVDLVSGNEDLRVLCSVAVCVLADGQGLKSCGDEAMVNENGAVGLVRPVEAWSPLCWLVWSVGPRCVVLRESRRQWRTLRFCGTWLAKIVW